MVGRTGAAELTKGTVLTTENAARGGVRFDGDNVARLAAVVEASHDAIVDTDLGGIITSWNPGAERLYGYLATEAIGRERSLLIETEFQAADATRLVRVASGERIEMFGVPHKHKSGTTLDVSLTLAPTFDTSGLVTGVASTAREVGDLALAQGRSQRLVEASLAAAVSVDGDFIVTLVSDEVELLFGYVRSELIGQPVDMLIPTLEQTMQAALLQGFIPRSEIRSIGGPQIVGRRKDGSIFQADISVSSSDVAGRLVVTLGVGDVGDRISAGSARRASAARARQLAASIDVAFVLRNLDPPGYLYVSPGYENIFGCNPTCGDHRRVDSLQRIHPQDEGRFLSDYWNFAQIGVAAQAEYRIIRSDGEVRWVRSMTWPIIETGGGVTRTADTIEDVTERRLAEAAIRSAHAQAEKARSAKDEFLSRTSHELRTPLNAVLGFAQVLELDVLTSDQRDSVTQILEGGRHLLALIDDVLDIAMIEGNRLDLTMEPVVVSDLIEETVQLMTPLADVATVTLHVAPESNLRRRVYADSQRLRQVLLNLLSNAIKYNRSGGRVDISCEISGAGLLDIVIEDTGRGIQPEDLPRLFKPFDRLGLESTKIEGTGVGLALASQLMARMGGTLRATSRVGVGTVFTASISLDVNEPRPLKSHPAQPSEPGSPVGGAVALTLIYIEDSASNAQLVRRLVTLRPQWRLIEADHGAEGLELAVSSSPDLVLMDLHLPDMQGIDVLERLLADPRSGQAAVVVVSADANPHQISRLLAAGAQDYLTKPLNVARLLQILDVRAADVSRDRAQQPPLR